MCCSAGRAVTAALRFLPSTTGGGGGRAWARKASRIRPPHPPAAAEHSLLSIGSVQLQLPSPRSFFSASWHRHSARPRPSAMRLFSTSPASAHRSLLLLLVALVAATALSASTLGVEAKALTEAEPIYDPNNEAIVDKVSRYVLTRFFSKTDEEITESRLLNAAALRPTFHPSMTILKNIQDAEDVQEILQMPAPPPMREGANQAFPWSAVKAKTNPEWKVWVVLVTAPDGDASSRMMDTIFNDTVGIIKDESGADDNLTTFLAKVQDVFAGTSQYDSTREDDEGRDGASRLQKQRQDRAEQSRNKAKDYNFAFAPFTQEPDLMWHWWIWKVPVILFITPSTSPDRNYDMRYWKVAFISGLNSEKLLYYIGSDVWLDQLPVWDGSLAPGGSKSHLPLQLARPSNWVYEKMTKVPGWLFGIISTTLGGSLIQFLHKRSTQKKDAKKQKEEQIAAAQAQGEGGKSTGVAATSAAAVTKRK